MPDPASWSFLLADAGGAALAELSTATGRSITYKRNSYVDFQCTISHEDDAATLLLGALENTGLPRARAYRRGPNNPSTQPAPLLFNGYLAALSEQSDENSTLTATFRSPFGILIGDGDRGGRFLRAPQSFSAMDAGAIAMSLLGTANAGTGWTSLAASTAPTTKMRTRSYPVGQNIGTAITDLTSVLDGFDFFETFTSTTAGSLYTAAMLQIVASIGSINSTARFEYGPGTLANVSSVNRTTIPPQNSIFVTGGNGLMSTYQDLASVAAYGEWWASADYPTVVDQPTLDDKARGLVRSKPIKTLQISPELGLDGCPKPFDDFNLGDTVTFYANRGALVEYTQLRINGFTIPISDDGFESVQTQDPTTPEEDAAVRASLIAEVVS